MSRYAMEHWAQETFGRAELGDLRLQKRLVHMARDLAADPSASIMQACRDRASSKAAYRFIENDYVTPEQIFAPVRQSTWDLCLGENIILALSDTSVLSFPQLNKNNDLGPVGPKTKTRGMFVHSVLAATVTGIPLGLLDTHYWCRDETKTGQSYQRKQRPFEEKESFKWVRSLRAARPAQENPESPEGPTIIYVADREGDVHEVMEEIIATPHTELIIRARGTRCVLQAEGSAYECVRQSPALGMFDVHVTRKKGGFPARTARCHLHACPVSWAPRTDLYPHRGPVDVSLVWVHEVGAPDRVKPLEWFLWTTVPVTDAQQAYNIVCMYRHRWLIERYHYVLKSGCRIEEVQFETAARLAKVLMLYGPIAAQILRLTYLGRCDEDIPCTQVLTTDQWHTLYIHRFQQPPPTGRPPPTVAEAVRWISRLGGHMGRKGDGPPGVKTMWWGWMVMEHFTEMYRVMQAMHNSFSGNTAN